ncbi:hypothetical protein COOONC_28320 [Cooperia oncophora]
MTYFFLVDPVFTRVDYRNLSDCLNAVDVNLTFNNYISVTDLYYKFCLVLHEFFSNFLSFLPFRYIDQKIRLLRELKNPLNNPDYKEVCSNISFDAKKHPVYCERRLFSGKDSFFSASVPSFWKDALSTPIPKVPCATKASHFRPISICPVLGWKRSPAKKTEWLGDNQYSDRHLCSSGAQQGGALSPLLFLISTLDLPEIPKVHPSIEVKMFAVDIRI